MSREYNKIGLLVGHVHHIYASVPVYTVCTCNKLASWPGLAMSCLVRGGSKLRRDLSEKAPLPGPLWPSHRAAEISDILAGSWWNLRRIGRTRLTDRMLILHRYTPASHLDRCHLSSGPLRSFFFFMLFLTVLEIGQGKWSLGALSANSPARRGNVHNNNRYSPHCQLSCLNYRWYQGFLVLCT